MEVEALKWFRDSKNSKKQIVEVELYATLRSSSMIVSYNLFHDKIIMLINRENYK